MSVRSVGWEGHSTMLFWIFLRKQLFTVQSRAKLHWGSLCFRKSWSSGNLAHPERVLKIFLLYLLIFLFIFFFICIWSHQPLLFLLIIISWFFLHSSLEWMINSFYVNIIVQSKEFHVSKPHRTGSHDSALGKSTQESKTAARCCRHYVKLLPLFKSAIAWN